MRDAGARRAHPADLALVEMHAVREPDVVAQPAEVVEQLERAHAEALEAEALLVARLGQVGVQPHAARPRELGRVAHQLRRDRERRGRGQGDPDHGAGRGVVEAVDGGGARGQDRVTVLDDVVGRQPAVGRAEVHPAATRVEAQPDPPRRVDLDGEQVARLAREDVVVVGRRRAARAGEGGERRRGGGVDRRGVDLRPHGIEGGEPLEQRRVLGVTARGRLVEVVVAVDESGRGQHPARVVDARAVAQARGGRAVADGGDASVLADEMAVLDLAARVVDGRDRAALDDRPRHAGASCAARRTASRIFV